jgi:hypothetical protein
MKQVGSKCWALITVFLFVFNCTVYAAPHNVYTVRVPEEIGQIKERYQGDSEEVVIHIQDAHTSLEAQENLAKLIEHLVSHEGVNTVATEGAEGYLDYSFLRNLPGSNAKKEALSAMLQQGVFTGTEFSHITSERYFDLYGAETISLYEKNHGAFINTLSKREEILDQIEEVENILNNLKAPLYSPQIAAFDADVESYRNGESSFFEYCGKLLTFAGKAGIDISQYVNFTMLLEAKAWEDMIDFDKVDSERQVTIQAVSRYLDLKTDALSLRKKDIFSRELQAFESVSDKKATSTTEFYSLLKNLALEARIEQENIQNFLNFAQYISIFARLDKAGLLIETKTLAHDIENRLGASSNESKLIELVRNIRYLRDIVELKVLPEDVAYYREQKENFSAAVYKSFLDKNGYPAAHVDLLDEILPAVDSFYHFAEERSDLMAERAIAIMKDQKEKNITLIAGGFHTDDMTKIFKKKGVSYIVVTPQLNDSSENIPYVQQMLGAQMPFQQLIQSAFNTLMTRAKASLPDEIQDIVGFEVSRNTMNNTLNLFMGDGDIQELSFEQLQAQPETRAEWTELMVAMRQMLNRLNIDNYQWRTFVPEGRQTFRDREVASIYEEIVGDRRQYIVFYTDQTPAQVIQAVEFDQLNVDNAFVAAPLNTSVEQQVVASIAQALGAVDLETMPIKDFVQLISEATTSAERGAFHLNLATIPGEARDKIEALADVQEISKAEVNEKVALKNISLTATSDSERVSELAKVTEPVAKVLRQIDTALEGRAQMVMLPSSFTQGLQALETDIIRDKIFNYGDLVMFYEPAPADRKARIFMALDDIVNIAEVPEETTVSTIDYQSGEEVQQRVIDQVLRAVEHDIHEQELARKASGVPAETIEKISRAKNPVADSSATIVAARLARDMGIAAQPFIEKFNDLKEQVVRRLLPFVPAEISARTDVKSAGESALAIYIDQDYINQGFNEDEMLDLLERNIVVAAPKRIIIGADEGIATSEFVTKLRERISKDDILVGEERFIAVVQSAQFNNKVVVARKYDGSAIYTTPLAGTAKYVVKVDLGVDIQVTDKALTVLPATFAAFNSLSFLNKDSEDEFGNTEGLLQKRPEPSVENEFEYEFSSDVVNVLDGQNFRNVIDVVSGLMKQISARVQEQRIYEKTIALAA